MNLRNKSLCSWTHRGWRSSSLRWSFSPSTPRSQGMATPPLRRCPRQGQGLSMLNLSNSQWQPCLVIVVIHRYTHPCAVSLVLFLPCFRLTTQCSSCSLTWRSSDPLRSQMLGFVKGERSWWTETLQWSHTIGRVCELIPKAAINPASLQPLLEALVS